MKRLVTALALVGLLAVPAQGQINDGDIRQVDYLGHSGWFNGGSGTIALPFYQFAITGVPGSPNWDFLCVDANHLVNQNLYSARFSSVATGSLGSTRLGEAGLMNYRIAAYLYEQIESATDSNRLYDLQRAAWFATQGATGIYGGGNVGAQNGEYDLAYAAVTGGWTADNYFVVTDVASQGLSGGGQEFLVRVPVPEPGTLFLLGSGLLGFAFVSRRREDAA